MNKDQQFPYVDLQSIAVACYKNLLFIIILTCIGALLGYTYNAVRNANKTQYGYAFSYSVIPVSSETLDDQLTNDDIEASTTLGKSYMQIFADGTAQKQIIEKADVAPGSGVQIASTRTDSEIRYGIEVSAYNKEAVRKVTETLIDGLTNGTYGQIPGSRAILPEAVNEIRDGDIYVIDNSVSALKPVVIGAAAFLVISIVIICLKVIRNGYITHPQVLSEVIHLPIIGYAVTHVRRTGREPRK